MKCKLNKVEIMMKELYCCRFDDQEITMSENFLFLTLIIYDKRLNRM